MPALRSKFEWSQLPNKRAAAHVARDSPDPGQAQESEQSSEETGSQLEATPSRERRGESPMPGNSPGKDAKPTLSQTWAVDEPAPAICVQSVDAHMSCSSHSDAQLAAFFIDPRAK